MENETKVWLWHLEQPEEGPSKRLLEWLPKNLKEHMLLFKKNDDQARFAAGRYLLFHALTEAGQPEALQHLKTDEHGRYFIPGMPDFNISHSGNWVGLAWRPSAKVGLDIEFKRELDPSAFTKQFSPLEMQAMLASPNPLEAFFKNWTRKEAVMKAEGRGMRIPLHSIRLAKHGARIDGDERFWHYRPITVDEAHACHLCSDRPLGRVQVAVLNQTGP